MWLKHFHTKNRFFRFKLSTLSCIIALIALQGCKIPGVENKSDAETEETNAEAFTSRNKLGRKPVADATRFSAASTLIASRCNSCHGDKGSLPNLEVLVTEELWIASKLIVQGSAKTSPLFLSLTGNGVSVPAKPMPIGSNLTQAQIETIRVWINNISVPPVVSLTQPANGAQYVAPASITMMANATDSDGTIAKVQFLKNDVVLGESTQAPFTFTWTRVLSGAHNLSAVAIDNQGNRTRSASVTVNVSAVGPTVSISEPTAGQSFQSPATIQLKANAADADGSIDRVEYWVNGVRVGQSTVAPYVVQWTNSAAGTYPITARAYDNQGLQTTSAALNITVTPAPTPPPQPKGPTVSLTLPTTGTTLTAKASISIAANAADADGTVTKVEFLQNGTKIGEDTTSPYAYTWTNVTAGTYSITARATDNSGLQNTSTAISVTVVSAPPVVTLTGPSTTTKLVAPATLTYQATATDPDDAITLVEFYRNNVKVGNGTNVAGSSTYTFNQANVPYGTYSLTAKATDSNGLQTTSTALSITVQALPTTSLTTPVAGQTFTAPASVSLSANAADADGTISKVEFYSGGAKIGEKLTAPYTFSAANLAAGNYWFNSKAFDNQGNSTTSATVAVTVSSAPPPVRTAQEILTRFCMDCHQAKWANPTTGKWPATDAEWQANGRIIPGNMAGSTINKVILHGPISATSDSVMPPKYRTDLYSTFTREHYNTIAAWVNTMKPATPDPTPQPPNSGHLMKNSSETLRLGDRFYIATKLRNIFGPTSETIVNELARKKLSYFGGPCDPMINPIYPVCKNAVGCSPRNNSASATVIPQCNGADVVNAGAPMLSASSAPREAQRIQVCDQLTYTDTALDYAIKLATGGSVPTTVAAAIPTDAQILAAYRLFYPGQDAPTTFISSLKQIAVRANVNNTKPLDPWRFVMATICYSPDWQSP